MELNSHTTYPTSPHFKSILKNPALLNFILFGSIPAE